MDVRVLSSRVDEQQRELAEVIQRHAVGDGAHETAVPSLILSRYSNVTEPRYGVYKPCLCIVVQGAKEVWIGRERLKYDPATFLVASVDLPVTAQVTNASYAAPYLGLKLEFTPDQVLDVLRDCDMQIGATDEAKRGIFVSRLEPSLLDAVVRLVRLLDSPDDIPVLAPLFVKEILYRILRGQHGTRVAQVALEGSHAHRIRDVIRYIMDHFDRPIRIEELSKVANMSASTLHRHFKEVTAMSPIQFQKQLRLQEARRLLLSEPLDATEVAFRVGYESVSQFNREYSRMFGLPPIQDIRRLRLGACPSNP